MDITWGYIVCAIIGGVGTYWIMHKKGEEANKASKVPLIGPIMAFTLWLPKTIRGWDILVQKGYVAVLAFFGAYHWIFLMLAFILVLFDLSLLPPKVEKWMKSQGLE